MVAPNTQVFPLQHHLKGSNASITSFRNYSRIQSEMQRDGFEAHKENHLSLSLSKNGKDSGAGAKADSIALSISQHMQRKSVKTGLPSVLSTRMGTPPHGLNVQDNEYDTHHACARVSGDIKCSVAPVTADNPSCIPAFSTSAPLQSLSRGEEAVKAYNLYAEMFPGAYTPTSTCTSASNTHGEREFRPSKPLTAEHLEVVQFLPDVNSVEDGQEDMAKRLRFTTIKSNVSIEVFDKQTSKQGTSSCCVVDGTAPRDGAIQVGTGNTCSFNCAYKSNDCPVAKPTPQHSPNGFNAEFSSNMNWVCSVNAYSACGTSPRAEWSKALPTVGLKLFTNSAHAQMPKALLTFSEGEPSLPLSLEHSQQQASNRPQRISTPMHENSCTEADWGKFLALSATPVANETETASARVLPFQQRFKQLQAFLKQRDGADQNECMQALRGLSAAARSGHAVELETRAIRLSLEEGKEIKRMRLLNVLGKISEQSLDDAGATPHGPRLPAPGATAKLKSVP